MGIARFGPNSYTTGSSWPISTREAGSCLLRFKHVNLISLRPKGAHVRVKIRVGCAKLCPFSKIRPFEAMALSVSSVFAAVKKIIYGQTG